MKIVCLFAQRNEGYEGEYTPELLAAIDEYGNDDNPEYMRLEIEKAEEQLGYEAHQLGYIRLMTISVSDKKFDAAMHPTEPLLIGEITEVDL